MTGTESVAVTAAADTTQDRDLTDAVAANVARLRRNSGMDIERLATLSGLASRAAPGPRGGTLRAAASACCGRWPTRSRFRSASCSRVRRAPPTSFHVLRAAESRIVDSARPRVSHPRAVRGRRSARARSLRGRRWHRDGWRKPRRMRSRRSSTSSSCAAFSSCGRTTPMRPSHLATSYFFAPTARMLTQNPGRSRRVAAPDDDVRGRLESMQWPTTTD